MRKQRNWNGEPGGKHCTRHGRNGGIKAGLAWKKRGAGRLVSGLLLAGMVAASIVPVGGPLGRVEAAAKKPALSQEKATIVAGKSLKLKVSAGKETVVKVKWTSKKKAVATVSAKGVVKAKKAGKATIIASVVTKGVTGQTKTAQKKTYQLKCVVTVKAAPAAAEPKEDPSGETAKTGTDTVTQAQVAAILAGGTSVLDGQFIRVQSYEDIEKVLSRKRVSYGYGYTDVDYAVDYATVEEAADGAAMPTAASNSTAKTSSAASAKSADESAGMANGAAAGGAASASSAPSASSGQNAAATGDFSNTNLRELGVDEGDVVKTDGKFIYSYNAKGEIRIIRAEGAKLSLEKLFIPKVDGDDWEIEDMYIRGDRMILTMNVYDIDFDYYQYDEDGAMFYTLAKNKSRSRYYPYRYHYSDSNQTHLVSYDLSDRKDPKQVTDFVVEGKYDSSRISGDEVYLFTWYGGNRIPLLDGARPDVSDIYLSSDIGSNYRTYTMTSLSLSDLSKAVDAKVVYTDVDDVYVTPDTIILEEEDYSRDRTVTNLIKFGYDKGAFAAVGVGVVPGTIESSFSIDEDDAGNIRVASTSWGYTGRTNAVYVFDKDMKRIGRLTGIAKGEEIKSARYMNDILYLVTFENHDPLFAIDLKDPTDPKIIGKLEIPGFSDYMHFWDDTHLLGMGYDTDEKTSAKLGIKLSMFDISDPLNLKEESTIIIKPTTVLSAEDENGYHNDYVPGYAAYKAILADPGKNLIGFAAQSYTHYYYYGKDADKKKTNEEDTSYFVYSYENGKFVEKLKASIGEESRQNDLENARGIYIGQNFYLVGTRDTRAYDMADGFKEVGKLEY